MSNVKTEVEALLTRAQEHLNAAWALQVEAARLCFGVTYGEIDEISVEPDEPVDGREMMCMYASIPSVTVEQAALAEETGMVETSRMGRDGTLHLASVALFVGA